jgi:3-oxoadipate enol-lactonase
MSAPPTTDNGLMPYVQSAGARIYWEQRGCGSPVLLIMGLSFTLDMWFRVAPALEKQYRVILFDNRGVGRSGAPLGAYSIPRMASDAIAVMDAAGADSAHVIGASMGGMIAQELALRWPSRVRSLLLGCTMCGAWNMRRPQMRRLRALARWPRMSPQERVQVFAPLLYADGTPRERIAEDTAVRLRSYPRVRGYLGQIAGMLSWSSYRRLPALRVPTLVAHGDQDRLIPPENGRVLAERIPGARLAIIPGAGHMFATDQPECAERVLLEFLNKPSG